MRNQSPSSKQHFDLIPIDLVLNIFSRLPVKSVAQCRCVSKLWSSIIRRPNHDMLFPNKSTNQPRFLFALVVQGELKFYSSPQPDQLESITKPPVATHHHTLSVNDYYKLCSMVQGVVCTQITGYDYDYTFAVICNPVTGEYVTTPKVTMEGTKAEMYFGYDPVDKIFKVLCITWESSGKEKKLSSLQCHVFTLDNNRKEWRKIQCCNPYYPCCDEGICINGVLYFIADTDEEKRVIVCFYVRSEKFGFINIDHDFTTKVLVLVNYKDKLGVFYYNTLHPFVLWVLEDIEEHKWSKHIYTGPLYWPQLDVSSSYCAGVTGNGEIVFYKDYVENSFQIYYYNLQTKNVESSRVLTHAVSDFFARRTDVYTFANFVEDLKLLM